jgi:hypothetical protein
MRSVSLRSYSAWVLQREALALTRRELAVNLATTQRASADVFIDAQLIELDTLAALLE